MAFETYLSVDKRKPRRGRRIMYLLSGASHVALLMVGVAASYARVEEVAPKTVPVTIYTTLPATPPPPRGREQSKVVKQARRDLAQPTPTKLVQPPVPHRVVEDDDDARPGRPDGPIGGDGPSDQPSVANVERHFLPPNVAKGQLAIDPQAEPYRAHLSPVIQRSGMSFAALLNVCVDRNGSVVAVKMLTKVSDEVDAAFMSAIRTWRYTPYLVAGHPVPFCTNVRYQVSSGH